MPKANCAHCGNFRWIQGRGLCQSCHRTPAIRSQYASAWTGRKNGDAEPTEAELDALIAEQMKSLPPWWNDAEDRVLAQQRSERPPRVYRLSRSD